MVVASSLMVSTSTSYGRQQGKIAKPTHYLGRVVVNNFCVCAGKKIGVNFFFNFWSLGPSALVRLLCCPHFPSLFLLALVSGTGKGRGKVPTIIPLVQLSSGLVVDSPRSRRCPRTCSLLFYLWPEVQDQVSRYEGRWNSKYVRVLI